MSNYTVQNNVIILEPNDRYSWNKSHFNEYYPNDFMADGRNTVGFVDYANKNYRLAPGSPFKNRASDGITPGSTSTRSSRQSRDRGGTLGLQSQSMGQDSGSYAAAGLYMGSLDGSYSLTSNTGTGSQLTNTSSPSVESPDLLLIDYAFDLSLTSDETTYGSDWIIANIAEDDGADDEAALDQVFAGC